MPLYEVQRIVGKRIKNNSVQYKVKWKGYPDSDSTWEPLKHLENVQRQIKDFQRRNQKYLSTMLKTKDTPTTPSIKETPKENPPAKSISKGKKAKDNISKYSNEDSDSYEKSVSIRATRSKVVTPVVQQFNPKRLKRPAPKFIPTLQKKQRQRQTIPTQPTKSTKPAQRKQEVHFQMQAEQDEVLDNKLILAMKERISSMSQLKMKEIQLQHPPQQFHQPERIVAINQVQTGDILCVLQDKYGNQKQVTRDEAYLENIDLLLRHYIQNVQLPICE